MAVLFDSGPHPSAQDDERLAAMFADAGTSIGVSHVGPIARTTVEHWTAGSHDLFRARGDGLQLSRTHKQVRANPTEAIRVGYQHRGRYALVSGDHEEVGTSGRINVTDLTQPCEFTQFGAGAAAVSFEIAIDRLSSRTDVLRSAMGQLASSPIYPLLQAHLARLCDTMQRIHIVDTSPLVADATVQLTRAVLLSASGMPERRGAVHGVLYERIVEYVVAHLTEPGLTPAGIAAAHNISLRHLYRLWARNDVPIADWIRAERLAGAAHELSASRGGAETVSAVARQWGFADPSHFSRRFRRAYGMSPGQWRNASTHLPHEAVSGDIDR